MVFELELWDESIIQLENKSYVNDLIDKLDGKEKKYLAFKKGKILLLRIESDPFKRIHLYRRSLNKIKQTVQPISKAVCKNLVNEFLDGKRNWFKGINFVDVEPFEPDQTLVEINKIETDEELEEKKRKTIIICISSFFISIFSAIYMFNNIDNMSEMSFKTFGWVMGGVIGGIVLFIYLIFDYFEIRREIINRRKR